MNTDDSGKEIPNSVFSGPGTPCPTCGDKDSKNREVRNYSMMWHEGDIHCTVCGGFIRTFDAG